MRPSLRLRALVALTLLFGFYGVTLTVAGALFACAAGVVFVVIAGQTFNFGLLILFMMTGVPAFMLVLGVARARPPKPKLTGRPLAHEEAPKLFAILDELALAAKTKRVDQVYLSPMPVAGVTQIGGFVGIGAKRVLLLGVPTLATLRVRELRSVLAHEYGHFVGSDTALVGIDGYTRALFVSVLRTTSIPRFRGSRHFVIAVGEHMSAAIGGAIARFYARLYMRITHALSRKQELAADALSAELIGSAAASSALETASIVDPLYKAYILGDVRDAIDAGAVPTDLVEGFTTFRAKVESTPEGLAKLAQIRAEQTDPFDTHPALAERLAAFSNGKHETPAREDDDDVAISLLAMDWQRWLHASTSALFERTSFGEPLAPLVPMPWSEVPARAYLPRATKSAEASRRALAQMFADATTSVAMLANVLDALERNELVNVAMHAEPRLRGAAPHDVWPNAQPIVANVLVALVTGALIERGARPTPSLGERSVVWKLGDEDVRPADLVVHAFENAEGRAALRGWSARLSS